MDARPRIFVIGDVHGQLDTLIILLRGSGLVDRHLRWMGGTARLWFMGDFFDRGPEGIGTVELIMCLQTEASGAGGEVGALIGNHEVLLLAAHYFPDYRIEPGLTFSGHWENNLGQESDLAQLAQHHIGWLSNLPALTLVDGTLLVHADSFLYTEYGRTIAAVNKSFRALLHAPEPALLDHLLEQFTDRFAFSDRRPDGVANALRFLEQYGGQRLVHGHTPIPKFTGQPPDSVSRPLIYAGGLCVDVDAGMYLGSPGFVYEVPPNLP